MIKSHRRLFVCKAVAIVLMLLLVAIGLVGSRASSISVNSNLTKNSRINIPILNYHKVDDQNIALSVSPQEFDEQMGYLKSQGYNTISPDVFLSYIKGGQNLPPKPIIITFDDGYLDNYSNAYPILKKYGFTATIFLVTNLIGNDSRFMNWDQVREMQQSGFIFGSHTVNHTPLTKISTNSVKNELIQSRAKIKKELGYEPCFFAYPTGAYDLNSMKLVREAGYDAAFTIRYGQVGPESNLYALERIPIFKGQRTFQSFFVRLKFAAVLERLGAIRN
ncbi:polysaccharide deacetylase family protein [Dendrosporobacter sp. 1207_IL3150]|uniref:polysaccharide deacetylase family protein n=1 Tax=Dendrosporobacter sp. 1207_IL3150 TaxID=3084054 RepID=UPI002FD9940A